MFHIYSAYPTTKITWLVARYKRLSCALRVASPIRLDISELPIASEVSLALVTTTNFAAVTNTLLQKHANRNRNTEMITHYDEKHRETNVEDRVYEHSEGITDDVELRHPPRRKEYYLSGHL